MYPWRDLELISVTTVTNIVSLIQFALIPINSAKQAADNDATESQRTGTVQQIREFISVDMSWAATLFNAPLEFAQRFTEIATPMRVLLFAAIMFGLLNLLIVTFFVPGWRLILFAFDLFVPGMMVLGFVWVSEGYKEQTSVAVALIVIGLLYLLARIAWMILPLILRKNTGWDIKAIHQISCIFLNRVTQKADPAELDERAAALQRKYYEMDVGLLALASVNFDDDGRPTPVDTEEPKPADRLPKTYYKSLYIDIGIAAALALTCLILSCVGWSNLISVTYQGPQGNTMAGICQIITITFTVAGILRVVVGVLYMFVPRYRSLSLMLRRRFFQLIVVLSGITLLPILSMILRSTDTMKKSCEWMQFMDFRSNTENFLDYFMLRNATCLPCTGISVARYPICAQVCTYNRTVAPLEYKVLQDAPQVNEDDLSRIYLIPINLLEVYFLAVFIQVERQIFTRILDLLECLPAPTQHVEAKFASLLMTLQTSAGYIFKSYRHSQSLFYFTFTQIKLFVLFFASLFPIFPVDAIKDIASLLIPWMFFVVSLVISLTQIKFIPYVSILHNVVNGVGYFVGALAAMIASLAVGGTEVPPAVGTTFTILIFVAPIVTAFVVPFFAKKDDLLKPTNHLDPGANAYDLELVDKHEEFLQKVDEQRAKKPGEKDEDDLSEMSIVEESKRATAGGGFIKKGFLLLNYEPIHLKMGQDKSQTQPEMKQAKVIWAPYDVDSVRVAKAAREMQWLADGVLDVFSFNTLVTLMNVSVIFVSCCLGWGLGAGTAIWKKGFPSENQKVEDAMLYYVRCNGVRSNGTVAFPQYGAY